MYPTLSKDIISMYRILSMEKRVEKIMYPTLSKDIISIYRILSMEKRAEKIMYPTLSMLLLWFED